MDSINVQPEIESYRHVSHRWLVQASVGLGVMITALDTGGVNVSLYTLARHFRIDAATIAWLPLVAFLTVTSTLLLFGRLSDMFGSKRIFVAGFGVYGLGSLACALAPSFPLLLAFRGLQAVGVSMLSANSSAILTECFPPSQRGMALGMNSTIVGFGFFLGPIAAGFVITALGWHYVFFASVPLSLAGLALAAMALPRSNPVENRQFDFLGAFLFALAAVCLLLAVNGARSAPLSSPSVLGFASGAGLAIAVFTIVERRIAEPMLDLGLFRTRLFSLSLASAFAVFLGIAGQDFLVPLFIQQVMLLDPAAAGVASSTVPLMRMIVSSPSGFLSDRFGSRWLSALGGVLTGIGLFGLSRMDGGTTLVWMTLYLAVIGLGTGLFFSPNMHATMAAVPANRLGMAAGALGLRRNLGQSIGVALAAYLLQSSGGAGAAVHGFQLAFTAQTAFLAIAVLAATAAGSTLGVRRALAGRTAS